MSTPHQFNITPSGAPRRKVLQRPHFHLALGLSVAIGIAAVFALSHEAEAMRAPKIADPVVESLTLPPPVLEAEIEPLIEEPETELVEVQPGDSLALIFSRVGLSPTTLHSVLQSGPDAAQLKQLRPGQKLEFLIRDGELKALNYTIDRTRTLAVSAAENGFSTEMSVVTPEVRTAQAVGTIDSSLYAAGLKAGLSDGLIMQLAGIFGWDIDFALDIRTNDRFSVIFEQPYVKGERYGEGTILVAEFVNNGRTYRAVRFTDPSGHTDYYNAEGRSMRQAFLRSPVDFRRISSKFAPERYHPVLGVKRPHKGVDYAAAIGTPIRAAGDGKVLFVGTKGGYGRTVILQHGGHVSTLYGHLSRYGKEMRAGARVRQGQTIGYVGKSGLATGPHLHYEFRVNGQHRNPLTVKLPTAEPIKAAYKQSFQEHANAMFAQLEVLSGVRVASAEDQ